MSVYLSQVAMSNTSLVPKARFGVWSLESGAGSMAIIRFSVIYSDFGTGEYRENIVKLKL